jgi:hypothetical protein
MTEERRPRWQNKRSGLEKKKNDAASTVPDGWRRARFDGRQDVFVRVDDHGEIQLENGRVSMRYSSKSDKTYATSLAKIELQSSSSSSSSAPPAVAATPAKQSDWGLVLAQYSPARHHVCFVCVRADRERPACAIAATIRFVCSENDTKSLARARGPIAPGIATVDAIVELVNQMIADYVKMGALMDVDTRKNPRKRPRSSTSNEAPFSAPTKMVMVVLDNKEVYEALQKGIRTSAYEVLMFWCASNGQERVVHLAKSELVPLQAQSKKRKQDS